MSNIKQWIGLGATVLLWHTAAAQNIPLDPAVKQGKLANGFTYYIRHNEEPKGRASFYLVNKAGSILEDEDQRGLAHFLEHMNFNGTKHFPRNKLVDYLQKAGVSFGADLNAYTFFDETVYKLPIPTADPVMVKSAVQIMRDWAQEATLDAAEIEKERGIILEEGRLIKGGKDRMMRKYLPMLFNNSRYAARLPIGLEEILKNFNQATIKRFHQDWYRPDLQALIIVGDIDVKETEKMVKKHFADLRNPAGPRERPDYTIPLTGKNQFLVVTDPEVAATSMQVFLKHRSLSLRTEADYLESIRRNLFLQMLGSRRYAELTRKTNASFSNASTGLQNLQGGLEALVFEVTAKEGELQYAFAQTWEVLEKVKRFGFTQTELDRAKQQYLRTMESSLKEKNKTSSVSMVEEYQRNFLTGEAAPGIEWEHQFALQHLNHITLADIKAVAEKYISDTNRDILVIAPEKAKATLPDSAAVITWINKAHKAELVAYQDVTEDLALMPVKPTPGKIVSRTTEPAIGTTKLLLSNGLTVILKPTTFKNDEIKFRGFSAGGSSVLEDDEFDAISGVDRLVESFGLAHLDPVQLSKALNGKQVGVNTFISARSQSVNGATSTEDLETALQMVYLRFTQPRKDSALYTSVINNSKEAIRNRYADPNNAFNDTMAYVMGDYHYRNSPPTLIKLSMITLDRSYELYKQRFADASGFTFVFTGNFDLATIEPLLEQYLGALPSLNRKESARDLGTHIPAGQLVKVVRGGSEDKALLRLVFSGDYPYSPVNNTCMNALGQILQIKLLERMREAEGEVYSPSVQFMYNKLPKNRYAYVVAFGCAPRNIDHLVTIVKEEMAKLRTEGVTVDDIQKFRAAYAKNVETALLDNSFWLGYLCGQAENGEDMLEVTRTAETLKGVTPAALKETANLYLTERNVIQFMLVPESYSVLK
ncbi:insulinase family protein [Chitinophaga niabensis]|uniref:M16 family metallopeptidase n=1 Tax=Chitinophaga niabensis TaxID=536979 RepID=UPI0031BB3888